ncbi:hypothetical protein GEMRC1_010249 [Eukaryota sp. GEM-RC1]
MSFSEPSLKNRRLLVDSDPHITAVEYRGSRFSTIISTQTHFDSPSSSPYFMQPHCKYIRLQQSLLALIDLHILRRSFKASLEDNQYDHLHLLDLKQGIHLFFKKVGYVSHHFFESALLAVNVFFQTNTFPVRSQDLPQLCSVASHFGAEVQFVFLKVYGTFDAEEISSYSHLISGLEFKLRTHSDLEFLNKSSFFFPRLQQLHVNVHSSISRSLIELLKVNTTVTSVILSGNSIGVEGAKVLADALKNNSTVSILNLWNNSIGDEGARALAGALKVNTTITSIDLSFNSIGSEGAMAFAEVFKVNTAITSVDLDNNNMGDEGARALAEALKDNASVTRFNISSNSIEDDGARALAEALKVNNTVTSINIDNNDISDEGCRVLFETLKLNTSIRTINLSFNSIGDEGARALAGALKINSTVVRIELQDNFIGDEGSRSLAEALEFNFLVKIEGVCQLHLSS